MFKILVWPAFLLLLPAQWLVPVQMIWKKDMVLTKGTSFKFQTAPVDPSDPFIGKYIILDFKENSLKTMDSSLSYNSRIYVSFYNGSDGFAKIKTISSVKPPGTDYVEATINYITREKNEATVFINYPFDKFYMQEYKAPKAEKIYRESNIDSTIKVYALVKIYKGDATVKNVYINDSLINDVIDVRNIIK